MSQDQFAATVRSALECAWGYALDVSQSKDFRHEDGSLNEAAYLRAKANILDSLTASLIDSPSRRA